MSEDRIQEARLAAAIEAWEYNLVSVLKPQIKIDGEVWCVLWGADTIEGVCGFGDTPYLAILAFNKAFHASALVPTPIEGPHYGVMVSTGERTPKDAAILPGASS